MRFGQPFRFNVQLSGRLPALMAALALALACSACTKPAAADPTAPLHLRAPVTLYEHPLEIRFLKPQHPLPGAPLVLYATGDGGFRGLDRDLMERMARDGYFVAGFNSHSYLKHLGYVSDTTTPVKLSRDYGRIIAFAKERLELPGDARTLLVGLSRGAGLEVVAAGQGSLQPELSGIIALGLTKEEEHVHHYKYRKGRSPGDMPRKELVEVQTYEYLPRLSRLPVAVIQSTHDRYLPARAARALFGPDTGLKRFRPVEASSHSFGGAHEALFRELDDSLAWVTGPHNFNLDEPDGTDMTDDRVDGADEE